MHRARPAVGLAAGLLLCSALVPREAGAADAILFSTWDSGVVDEELLAPGASVAATGETTLAASMAGNPALHGSAWAHTGSWWSLYVAPSPHVTIRVVPDDPAELAPGVAVWAGAEPFDGGTESWAGETSNAGFRTPHSFNAFGPLGDPGTLWMQEGEGGNAIEFLGYAIAGPSYAGATGWGEAIEHGAHDGRLTDAYATAVTGAVENGVAVLQLAGVKAGWLTIYVGGTDPARSGGAFRLEVKAAQRACGLGAELALLLPLAGARRRRRARRAAAAG